MHYDWRLREVLTDEGVPDTRAPAPTMSVLRHQQRLGLVRALHRERPQGGRMRLWSTPDVLRVQAALDLQRAAGAKWPACADALNAHAGELAAVFGAWRNAGARAGAAWRISPRLSPASIGWGAPSPRRSRLMGGVTGPGRSRPPPSCSRLGR
ncbi:MAG: hypothetical protein ACLFQ5_00485 [Oceanicaulis sp.]